MGDASDGYGGGWGGIGTCSYTYTCTYTCTCTCTRINICIYACVPCFVSSNSNAALLLSDSQCGGYAGGRQVECGGSC